MEKEIRYLTDIQVSRLISIPVQTLRNQRFRGKGIPYVKMSKSVRYRYDDVIAFMESRKVTPRN